MLPLNVFRDVVLPRLKQCRVISITLTGGEPFAHPEIVEIVQLARENDLSVSICTNGTLCTTDQAEFLAQLGNVHVNVSLDGFRPESHGKFRGDSASFFQTLSTIQMLGEHGILHGILVTPNHLAHAAEYEEICEFAAQNGATYVLMNPLSKMGRGVRSQAKLSVGETTMDDIRDSTARFAEQLDLVNIRFPNSSLPLASCEAGNIIYMFVNGDVTVCPYLVFAADAPGSAHTRHEFIPGNLLQDADIAERLDRFNFHERYRMGQNDGCRGCGMNSKCGKGCPAAVVASGGTIGSIDYEMCPVSTNSEEPL
jgi:radical SAM protein with 4Fe4S-binding SPASM domain